MLTGWFDAFSVSDAARFGGQVQQGSVISEIRSGVCSGGAAKGSRKLQGCMCLFVRDRLMKGASEVVDDRGRPEKRELWALCVDFEDDNSQTVSGTVPILLKSIIYYHKAPLAISRGGRSEALGRSLCVIRVGIHQW